MANELPLPPEQREHYLAIAGEVQRLLDDASFQQARERIDRILSGIPDDASNRMLRAGLLARRGEVHLEAGDLDEAFEDVESALALGWEHSDAHATLAWINYQLDRLEAAREQFDLALELAEYEPSLLTGRALVLQELDELEAARADLTNAIHAGDPDATLYAMRSDVHAELGNLEQARRDITRARELDPEDPDFAVSQARALFIAERTDEALAALDEAISTSEPSLEALLLRSYLRLADQQSSEARADAIRASNQYPDEAFAFIQLAFVELAEGNTPLALKAADRAVRLDPSLPDGYMARGAARQLRGELAEAQEDFARGRQAAPEMPMFLFGSYYESLQESPFARSAMEMLGEYIDFDEMSPETAQAAATAAATGEMPDLSKSFPIPGLDPMKMLGQVFDDEGNIRGPFKPILRMAMRNAPSMLKHVPPHMLQNMGMGGLDPEQLENFDMSDVSPEQLEEQLKQFYKLVQSGKIDPDMLDPSRGGEGSDDD